MRARMLAVLLPLLATVAGCNRAAAEPERVEGLSERRALLSEGYSLLHTEAGQLDWVNAVLYVKFESQEFDDLISAIGRFGGEMKRDLERIARDYPGVRIDLKPLPEMETRKRFAIGKDRLFEFSPLAGKSRREFERTMLIGMANALNHERHLCRVMAAEEPDAGLKKFLLASEKRYDALHARTLDLLGREHFRLAG